MFVARRSLPLDVALLCALALVVRLVHMGFPPDIDEMNALLAAHSLIANGAPLLDGVHPYTRARLFTSLVAGMMRLFGDSLVVARMPSVIAGVALVAAVYLWVRTVAGRWAGVIAAGLLALNPDAIYHSQLVRFYELHALLLFVGAAAVYRLTEVPFDRSRATMPALIAVLTLALALHLQVLTVVGLAGLGLWAVGTVGPSIARRIIAHRHRTVIVGGLVVAVAAAAVLAVRMGALTSAARLFTYSDAWAAADRGNIKFYHWALLDDYATLWTLFPVLVLISAARRPRATAFCATIFGVAFVVQSLAAWKHVRYFQYAMPYFFALAGMGVAEVIPPLARRVRAVRHTLPGPFARPTWRGVLATGAACVVAIFLLAGNGAFPRLFRMLAATRDGDTSVAYHNHSDWSAAAPRLRQLSDSAALLVSSSDLKSLYYLGRLDVILYRDHLYSADGWAPEFSDFPKLGRPVISTPASVHRLVACYPTGLIIAESGAWRAPWGVPSATADYIERTLTRVPLPAAWRLEVFRWRTPSATPEASCLDAGHPPLAATSDASR